MIKANHGCGYNYLVTADMLVTSLPQKKFNNWLSQTYGRKAAEWGYRGARKRLFIEELLVTSQFRPPIELSLHAFSGNTALIEINEICPDGTHRKGYFDTKGLRREDLEKKYRPTNEKLPMDFVVPKAIQKAMTAAKALGNDIDYARFDFFIVAETLYGGEITVYPGSGLGNHESFKNYNLFMTDQWRILDSWFLTSNHTGTMGLYAKKLIEWLKSIEKNKPER